MNVGNSKVMGCLLCRNESPMNVIMGRELLEEVIARQVLSTCRGTNSTSCVQHSVATLQRY